MGRDIPERDWKYMRSLKPELLAALCGRINRQARALLQEADKTEHDRYLALFQYMQDSDRVVADCFDDWGRSSIRTKMLLLRRAGLLSDEQLAGLSDEIRQGILQFEEDVIGNGS